MAKQRGFTSSRELDADIERAFREHNCNQDSYSANLRKLLWILLNRNQKEQTLIDPAKILYSEELELLEGWDCSFRALVKHYNRYVKLFEYKIHCARIDTRTILGTNMIDLVVCKRCHDRHDSELLLPSPTVKKSISPISKTQSEEPQGEKKRESDECIDCGVDISHLVHWKTRCLDCYKQNKNQEKVDTQKEKTGYSPDYGVKGSPAHRKYVARQNRLKYEPEERKSKIDKQG